MKIRSMVQGRWKIFADQQLALIQPGGQNLPIKLQLEPFLIYLQNLHRLCGYFSDQNSHKQN